MLNGQQLVRVGANLSGIAPGDDAAPLNNPSLKKSGRAMQLCLFIVLAFR